MSLDRETTERIEAARRAEVTPDIASRLIAMLDLTSLENEDTPETIASLCDAAVTVAGPVAAVCVYPRFIAQAKAALADTGVKIATVVDFPEGLGTPEVVLLETEAVLASGADEIDLVFPYRRFLADAPPPASKNIRAVREVADYAIRLKVILEVGAYPDFAWMAQAAEIAIQGGADFLKTSTGKHGTGASLEAASVILSVIADSGLPVGFKVSGGIREPSDAAAYLALAESMLGAGWATPMNFRVGASSLLPKLLSQITAPPEPR
jgi:deoxyribose-phosphate aldolase